MFFVCRFIYTIQSCNLGYFGVLVRPFTSHKKLLFVYCIRSLFSILSHFLFRHCPRYTTKKKSMNTRDPNERLLRVQPYDSSRHIQQHKHIVYYVCFFFSLNTENKIYKILKIKNIKSFI